VIVSAEQDFGLRLLARSMDAAQKRKAPAGVPLGTCHCTE
jgi:hypothetical protein